jgi:hypothetical protein
VSKSAFKAFGGQLCCRPKAKVNVFGHPVREVGHKEGNKRVLKLLYYFERERERDSDEIEKRKKPKSFQGPTDTL